MKLQFKHQKFQADAAKAVVDVFAGQPYLTPTYMIDKGRSYGQGDFLADTGWNNQPIVPGLTKERILANLQKVQRSNQLKPSDKLEGQYNLTIEMETGVGKTYTYIKTMYELNRHYGWSKFIVVVPSVAIREGVFKSFQVTEDHFAAEYGRRIRYFIYDSNRLTDIDRFASDHSINVMIINNQAFVNARGEAANRIHREQESFGFRKPIDVIKKTNPILIIDEPQSVEGPKTKEKLRDFNPLMTLRYSATHRSDSIYNMVYRLDALEAYNKHLVKKIAVKGITESGTTATEGYVYFQSINLSGANPTATIEFDLKGAKGLRRVTRTVGEGFDLYPNSGDLEEYHNGFTVKRIDGRDNSIEFLNGQKLFVGDVIGKIDEQQLRRLQIRETILSHMERERQLFSKGIKVLSLFFIDEVAKYKLYDGTTAYNGVYADMFEEEYSHILENLQTSIGDEAYQRYLDAINPHDTHAGYFSVDKKERFVDTKQGDDKKAKISNDVDAYSLIMKKKELLLDLNPKKSPVRFIFSHSALREGWDNPNVFQICTLKQSSSDVRKRQEVGRGLRLCVNQDGDRMDANILGNDVHNINLLTVVASESYDSFARGLQSELAEAVADRPRVVNADLFRDKVLTDNNGHELPVDSELAQSIHFDLIAGGYIDRKGTLTDKYYSDKANGAFHLADELLPYSGSIIDILDSVYNSRAFEIEDSRKKNVELRVDEDKLAMPEFKALWNQINAKSVYVVDFDTEELIQNAIAALDAKLRISPIYFRVESGSMRDIQSKSALESGEAFKKERSAVYDISTSGTTRPYDLVGKLESGTGLTRKDIIAILRGIQPVIFNQFKNNPEEFILKATELINEQKATAIVQHITYNMLDSRYDTTVFTEPTIKGRLGVNAMKTDKHLYDHLIYDSDNERKFAADLDINRDVAVYVKLPNGFYISTPVGKYNPDWAIAFYDGSVKHIYFVAETKGSMSSLQLRELEQTKLHCAREHFKAISSGNVVYDVVDGYQSLLNLVKQ